VAAGAAPGDAAAWREAFDKRDQRDPAVILRSHA
jgi:hypothetical protein